MSVVQVKGQLIKSWTIPKVESVSFEGREASYKRQPRLVNYGADSLRCWSCDALGQSWRLVEYLARQNKTVGRVSIALLTPKKASKNVRGVEKRGGAGVWNDASNWSQILREIAFFFAKCKQNTYYSTNQSSHNFFTYFRFFLVPNLYNLGYFGAYLKGNTCWYFA